MRAIFGATARQAVTVALACATLASSVALATIELPLDRLGNLSLDAEQEQLEALLKISQNDAYLVAELGRIAYQRGNFELARKLWLEAAAKDPNLPGPDVQLAFADIASGQLDGAQRRLEELNVPGTSDPHVLIAASELAMVRKDQQQAYKLIARAMDVAPQLPATHLTLGHFLETAGDLAAAQASYEEVTKLIPERTHGWLRLAALLFRQRRFDEAFAAFQSAEKCRGLQPLAETRMGEAFYLQGDLYAAHRQFTAAVKRKEDDPFPRLRLAQTLGRAGRTQESSALLEQILAKQEYPDALRTLAENELKAGNSEAAIGLYRRLLKASPTDWVAAHNLAILLVQTEGPADEAVAMVDRAAKLAPPTLASLQGTKGCALWHAGRAAEAEPLLAAAIAAVPNYALTRYCYGQTLHALKRDAEAREQFEACLFLDPDFPHREKVSRILAGMSGS